jgi:IPT/TIG domain
MKWKPAKGDRAERLPVRLLSWILTLASVVVLAVICVSCGSSGSGIQGPKSDAQPGGAGSCATPVVTSVSPTSGAETGGDEVTINGRGFTGAAEVDFGNTKSATMTVDSNTRITATSPAGAGTVHITVVKDEGECLSLNSPSDLFTYVGSPAG